MEFKTSLLVSNLLDPFTKTDSDLIQLYETLALSSTYDGLETRVIHHDSVREVFNRCAREANWDVTVWLTGEMGRSHYNLASLDDAHREASLQGVYALIDLSSKQVCNRIGIASGILEDVSRMEQHIEYFRQSLVGIFDYIDKNGYDFDVICEPLDQWAHKKNVIGSTENTLKLIHGLKTQSWLQAGRFTVCWDSAHVALNQEDFKLSIQKLGAYISRIHFADAVVDDHDKEYGDHHRSFDDRGIMNLKCAREIIEYAKKACNPDAVVYVACEVRTHTKAEAWNNERVYRKFMDQVLTEVDL